MPSTGVMFLFMGEGIAMNFQSRCSVRKLWLGMAAVLAAGTVQAQEPAPAPDEEAVTLKGVTVTARKREQSLLDVTVPVTAIEADKLVQQNLVSIDDYAHRVPGLRVTGRNISNISIRGVTALAGNPTTAVTVDDVPFSPSMGAAQGLFPDFDPSDLARIEVLRGPQGTLYGASAMGGLIKYVTADPDPGQFSGRLEGGVSQATDGGTGFALRGSANLPLLEDRLAVRVSGFRRRDPAYLDSVNPTVDRKDVNTYVREGGRVALMFQPTDNFKVNLSRMQQTLDQGIIGPVELTPYPSDFTSLYGRHTTAAGSAETHNRHAITQLRIDWDTPIGSVTSSSGWVRTGGGTDEDRTTTFPFVLGAVYPGSPAGSQARIYYSAETEKFSQELRLASSSASGRVDWLVGGFYTDEDATIFQDLKAFSPTGSVIGDVVIFPNQYGLQEKAVFGSVTYHFTDRFNVEVGGRYGRNEQTSLASQTVAPAAQPLFGPSTVGDLLRSAESATTWLVSPQFRISDDVMVYARAATGYRAGGPNIAAAPNPTFASDSVANYELGVKGRFLDRRLTLDASVFNIDWDDIQLTVVTPTSLNYTVNSGKARNRGLEAAAELQLGAGWVAHANASFVDAELREDFPASPGAEPEVIALKGDALPFAARFSGNLGVERLWDVGHYAVTVGGNVGYVGSRPVIFRTARAPVERQQRFDLPSYSVIDLYARIAWDAWGVNFYVRNLGNSQGVVTANDGGGARLDMLGSFIAPRIVGMTVSRDF